MNKDEDHSETKRSLADLQSRLLADTWVELNQFHFSARPAGIMLTKLLWNKILPLYSTSMKNT